MSMQFTALPSTSDNEYFRAIWSLFFGRFIESGREKAGLSIEQAATLADIRVEEWAAIEAGDCLPATRQQFRAIAEALDMKWDTMTSIVLLCRESWGVK